MPSAVMPISASATFWRQLNVSAGAGAASSTSGARLAIPSSVRASRATPLFRAAALEPSTSGKTLSVAGASLS